MELYTALSLSAQTAYAQLLDAAQALELARSVANLRGSFASKTVKGRLYWYFQYTELSGRLRQFYVGPDSRQVREWIAQRGAVRPAAALEPLARSAIALGCAPVLPAHFRVIRRLSDYGFFRAGGVLVGTHAFLAFGNMLGVSWGDGSRTQDVDFAHGGKPYRHAQLGITLQPLKFMEYLLQDLQQAVLFCADGAVVVNVPQPLRYAMHKLIVAGERGAARAAKSSKDLRQSASLFARYQQGSAWEAREAWSDLLSRGPGWKSRALRGLAAVDKLAPELAVNDWLEQAGRHPGR